MRATSDIPPHPIPLSSRERASAALGAGWMVLLVFLFAISAHAQGILPPQSTSTTTTTDVTHPLLTGEKVPESLTVIGENGKKRALLSYKSPIELLVVIFLSPRCERANDHWPELRRLDERYKDWRVSFVALSASSKDTLSELQNTLKLEKLPWPLLHDEQRAATSLLKVTGTPEILIIDEYGVLKYRGPVAPVPQVLDTLIGHIEMLKEPEPPFDGECTL